MEGSAAEGSAAGEAWTPRVIEGGGTDDQVVRLARFCGRRSEVEIGHPDAWVATWTDVLGRKQHVIAGELENFLDLLERRFGEGARR